MSCRLTLFAATTLLAVSHLSASEVRVWIDAAEIDTTTVPGYPIMTIPAELASKDIIDLRATFGDLIALTADKHVYIWGQAGYDDILTIPAGVQGHAIGIGAGRHTAFAVLDSGTIVTWGDTSAQVGSLTPTTASFVAVGQGLSSGVAWTSAGIPSAWGDVMHPVPSGTLVAQAIAVRDGIIYRRLSDNLVFTTAVLMGEYPALNPPVPAMSATRLSVALNTKAIFALTSEKKVVGWGNSTTGILPVPTDLTDVTQVELGYSQAIARLTSGTVRIWGTGPSGAWTTPTGLTHVRMVAAGAGFSAVVISRSATAIAWNDGGAVVANSSVGTTIGTLNATDPDSQDTQFTYALVPGEGDAQNSLVSISGTVVNVSASLPQGAATMTIRVRVTDPSGATFEAPLAIQRSAAPNQGSDSNNSTLGCGVGGGISLVMTAFLILFAKFKWRS